MIQSMVEELKTKQPIEIKSIQHLIHQIQEKKTNFFISLGDGHIRKNKKIFYSTKNYTFIILDPQTNEKQILTHREICDSTKTNIGKAIELKALYTNQ